MLSGTLGGDMNLKNVRSGEGERLGGLLYLLGKTQTPCKEAVGPGALVAVAKLKNTRTGDTLCDEKAPFSLPVPDLPRSSSPTPWPPRKKARKTKSTPPCSGCWTKTSPCAGPR